MWKTIVNGNKAVVITDTGMSYQRDNLTKDQISVLMNTENFDDIIQIMFPDYTSNIKKVFQSKFISIENGSAYWKEVSNLSVPVELVDKIIDAENKNNELLIETYKNFWTLMSLNPSEECRKSLFAFLLRHGLQISKHGFFIAYRNVDKTYEEGVYTDHHSHSFRIKIGEIVTMPREKVDSNNNIECSSGLHLGGRLWLEKYYYGDTGMVCLCNPADVCATPERSEYGKLRTCAYLPIDIIQYGEDNHPIKFPKEDGFDCSYVGKVIYEGLFGEEKSKYHIKIPIIDNEMKDKMFSNILEIAKQSIVDRVIK